MRFRKGSKKWLAFVLSGVMVFAAAAGFIGPKDVHAETVYKDGAYIGVSDANETGYTTAVVMIADGNIAMVRLTEMNAFGDAKPADYPWAEYHEAMEILPQWFIEANSAEVDIYSGATGTSVKAAQAVERALLKASDPGEGRYFDGTFFGRSAADDHGYGTALVTIEDDVVVKVVLEEVMPDGTWKDWETYPYVEAYEAKLTMEARFTDAGHPDVDGISGATSSAEKWIAAVTNALRMAEK